MRSFYMSNHLERDFATWGSWAWITGIMNLNLDLSGIDFDTAYIEFYIDSGTIPIGYLELRLGGAAWDPDFQNTGVTVDDQPGYDLGLQVLVKTQIYVHFSIRRTIKRAHGCLRVATAGLHGTVE